MEYKRGAPKSHDADALQLCAQAICLEEMLCCTLPEGALFYGETHRRVSVTFTEDLRQKVSALSEEMHALFRRGYTPVSYTHLEELFDRFMRYFSAWEAPPSALNSRRNEIFQTCLCAGQTNKRGLYTLTVPTGGGKTLSSLAFALAMAKTQGLKHIIYVIPYTSIIDQNAAIFAQILGEENVLEHHKMCIRDRSGIDGIWLEAVAMGAISEYLFQNDAVKRAICAAIAPADDANATGDSVERP